VVTFPLTPKPVFTLFFPQESFFLKELEFFARDTGEDERNFCKLFWNQPSLPQDVPWHEEGGIMKAFIFFLAGSLFIVPTVHAENASLRVAESRKAIKTFAEELQNALQQAIKTGGPAHAIQVCEEKAPEIAAGISEEKGWFIGRTSLKFRNPINAPDSWELKVLRQFEESKARGEDPNHLEYSQVVEKNGRRTFRYMKAIPTKGICLTCHGDNIPSKVSEKLNELYPGDKARGFKKDDIRGAFTIIQHIK
jgi:hypothetical protein